ncbi:MAG: YidC/Oxa1 family membrane protein insertase [Acidimicrobiia bacterium]|nr:YidC/Oxa1 family membrane protein insertase [Acidimicrobiia bacterium]
MEAFFKAFATVLAFFYDITGNYALAIVLLTLVVMIVVTPLTLKGTRSMMVMQQLQPEMRKIQTRYKDDRQKLNEELLKFYKENNINPLGGCLPLLVQMPVFLVLYQVLHGLTRRVSDLGGAIGWASQQFSQALDLTKVPSFERVFDPAWISPSSKMYENLSTSTQMKAFGLDLSESASKALQQGILHALPFLVLIAIVAVTGFVQQRQIQGRSTGAQMNSQQQMIMKIMPFFLPVISFGLPSGLVIYFAVSNLYRIGQQAFISKSIYGVSAADGTKSWKHLFGFGLQPAASGSSKGARKSGSKDRSKAIAARSRPAKTTSGRAGATKGGSKSKPVQAGAGAKTKGSSRTSGRTDSSTGGRTAPSSTNAQDAKPSSGGSSSDASSDAPPLQPRARKKKR